LTSRTAWPHRIPNYLSIDLYQFGSCTERLDREAREPYRKSEPRERISATRRAVISSCIVCRTAVRFTACRPVRIFIQRRYAWKTSGHAAKWAQLCRRASYPGDGLAVVPEVAFLHDKPVGPETEQRHPGQILAAVGVIPWVSWPG
jgi:hypothetical protein